MTLEHIHILDVRNISEAKIEFSDRLNVFYGNNGSGKSSVLESIYLLSSAKSFRTRQITRIIKENKNKLTLFGKLVTVDSVVTMGLERSVSRRKIQINGEQVKRISTLAQCLPVLVVTQDSHKLLESGPQWRRQFLDWGLFHVEQNFLLTWMNYRKLLKNRNMALHNKANRAEISAWNQGLSSYGETYSIFRESYLKALLPRFKEYAQVLLGDREFELKYKQGWPREIDLLSCLESQYYKDNLSGRTVYGPHRADITIHIDGRNAKDHVSRGQQKMLVYALYFSQVSYLKEKSDKNTLILLDDLGAELDLVHVRKLLTLVSRCFSQVCITTANLASLPLDEFNKVKMFHVKQGVIV